MEYEWDKGKAETNLRKHGISFEEATTAFRDPLSVTAPDLTHSSTEDRFVTFGLSSQGKLLTISHTERGEIYSNHYCSTIDKTRKKDL